MNKYMYSASTNSFYPVAFKQNYVNSKTWPEDAIDIDDSVYEEYASQQIPEGKIRTPDNEGYPSWGNIPAATPEDIMLSNTRTRDKLAQTAAVVITMLQAGIATSRSVESDSAALVAWQGYLCDLRAMTPEDLQQSPAQFPKQPARLI
ncbi:TPA: tail fiber assembly protein [Citrobacter freundii]|nr:tail fiber assembly protein [Citrobacter freundii]HCJ7774573.1 tail fiber assembly protein [Citrobacter freundii]HCT4952811.1 tail fiber assembly protein [Citrobacter freundii]HEI8706016.1 tail fiber assembly protein [Citrobacter freundii]